MSDALLPEGARLIHVGPQKTGTTAVQVALFRARRELPAYGAYYHRRSYRRRNAGRGLGIGGWKTPISYWLELVEEIRKAGPLRACVSNEDFARAEAPVVQRIVEDLGGDGGAENVQVVAFARRLDRLLPSFWQERVKAGITLAFDEWLDVVLDESADSHERWNVWMGHDWPSLVRRWTDVVKPERFTLVVADESDRTRIFHLFEDFLGLPPGMLLDHATSSNTSLSLSEVELVRQLHLAFDRAGLPSETRKQFLTRGVIRTFGSRTEAAPGPRSAPMPDATRARIAELSDRRLEDLRSLPIKVVGDLDKLRVPDAQPGDPAAEPLSVPVGLAAEAVMAAINAALNPPRP